MSPLDTITCTLDAQQPHYSRQYKDLSTHSIVTCKAGNNLRAVDAIYIDPVEVWRDNGGGHLKVLTNYCDSQGEATLDCNPRTPTCVPDLYDDTSDAYIVFPYGYSPHTATLYGDSGWHWVSCT